VASRFVEPVTLPGTHATLEPQNVFVHVQADRARLAAYREICGFEVAPELMPITFPQVQAAPLHMWLMLRPEFPVPLMGLVHIRNRFFSAADGSIFRAAARMSR